MPERNPLPIRLTFMAVVLFVLASWIGGGLLLWSVVA